MSDVLLISKIILGYEQALWPKKIGDKSCQSNFDKGLVRFWIFLSYIITTVEGQ